MRGCRMAKITYELDYYDDRALLDVYEQAMSLYCALVDIDQLRRTYLKYTDLSEEEYSLAEKIFDEINEIQITQGVRL